MMLRSLRPAARRSAPPAPGSPSRAVFSLAVVVLALATAACDTSSPIVFDQPPTITLTSGPVDTVSTPQSWLVNIAWTASDPDGRVDHFDYAIDPPGLKRAMFAQAETAWVSTQETHVVAKFHASHPDSVGATTASEYHVFVLRAVDDRGRASPLIIRGFFATTAAPDVEITRPVPNRLLDAQLVAPFRIEWRGHDPDGEGSGKPAFYRVRMLDGSDYETQTYLVNPDSLLREGEADGWADWQQVPGHTTGTGIAPGDLVPGKTGAVAVIAVDEAGAHSPYLLLDKNFLRFMVASPQLSGPTIHMSTALVDYTWPPGYSLDPSREIAVQ